MDCCKNLWKDIEPGFPEAHCEPTEFPTCESPDCQCTALDSEGLCEACWLSTK